MVETGGEKNILGALSSQLADAVAGVAPGIVRVNGRRRLPASGVIFAAELVLTANHVLERDEEITVATDGRAFDAQLVGRDPASDLAVLRVAGLGGSSAPRSSEAARVGQLVLALGRPSGVRVAASLGIVSALGGPLRTRRGGMLERYIATDATLYPGFSGGPLIDVDGGVLGILTSGLVGGVGLAIPTEVAWSVGETLAREGRVPRGYLGISSQPVRLAPSQRAGRTQESGLLIVRVEQDSPAEHGGLLLGDILVELDGQPITDTDDLQVLLAGRQVGATVVAEVIRGGAPQSLQIQIGQCQ